MTATRSLYDMTAVMSRMGNVHTEIFFIRLKRN